MYHGTIKMISVLSKLLAALPSEGGDPSAIWVKVVEAMASLGPKAFATLPDEARIRMIDALRRMLRFLQTGFDVGWQYSVSAPSIRAAIGTLLLANVFNPWAAVDWVPRTAEELTEMSGSGADVELIRKFFCLHCVVCRLTIVDVGRLLDALVGQKLFLKNEDHYQGWKGSWADDVVRDPTLASHFLGFFEWSSVFVANLPRHLEKTKFRNPSDTRAGNFQDVCGAGTQVYDPPLGDAIVFAKLKAIVATEQDEEIKAQLAGLGLGGGDSDSLGRRLDALVEAKRAPLVMSWAQAMSDFMESHSRYNHRSWTELFPTQCLVDEAKEGRKLVVDIGGGKGHDGLKFAELHPEIADGSVVVQDLPHVLAAAGTYEGQKKVVPMPHDYLQPQPVKGARVYYIHVVLHNSDDERAIAVLKNVVEAMEKGYSQLLVHESVVDVHDPHANATSQDIFMMGSFSAQERTRARWAYVIKGAGLAIRDIKMKKGFPDAVIVTEKV